MNITEIVVVAGRTFNHPHEQYSNLRPEVTLRATLNDGEDPASAVKSLQHKAEGLVEDHKQGLLKSLDELYQLSQQQAEIRGLQGELKRAQDRLDDIRRQNPALLIQDVEGGAPSLRDLGFTDGGAQ